MIRRIALIAAPLLAATGCGGGNSAPSAEELAPSSSAAASRISEAAGSAPSGDAPTKSSGVDLSCPQGHGVSGAYVSNDGSDVTVSWADQLSTFDQPTTYVSYIVTLKSADGQHSLQVAKKAYTNGDEASQFIYDENEMKQTNVTADGGDGTGLGYNMTFPGALAGMGDGWTATGTVNVDGQDILQCEPRS